MIPRLLGGLALVGAFAAVPARAADVPTRRFALFVGANDGGGDRVELRYAHDDARAVHGVLTDLGGLAPGDGSLLLDPDLAGLRAAFSELDRQLEQVDGRKELLFYYSGHSDEEGLLLGEDRLPWPELRAFLDDADAKVRMAVVDSCSSGALIRSKGGHRVAPFLVDEGTTVDGLAFITSSSRDEVSQEADRIGGSYFTHYLTTGLRGAADRSADGRVTLTEAYAFAREETLRRTERTRYGPQHANHEFDLSGSGDLVLTDLGATDAALVLGIDVAGRATVRDPTGHLVAELHKAPGLATSLALASGDYRVTISEEGRYGVADLTVAPQQSTPLSAVDLTWHDGEEATARGAIPLPTPIATSDELVRVQLVPGMPATPEGMVDRTLLGVVAGDTHGLTGLGFSGAWLHVKGAQHGHSFTMGAQRAEELRGSQWATLVNIAEGDSRGVQVSTTANVAATDTFVGLQSTFGVNWLQGASDAGQLASVNVSRGGLRGAQIGATNVAQELSGIQLGLVNVGRDVSGTQVGLVNVARDVAGMQLGLVNVARDVKGAPVGLFSFERYGRHDLLVFASDTDWVNGELRLGGDYLYTLLTVGARPGEHGQAGAGLGVHAPIAGPVWLDLDAAAHAYVPLAGEAPLLESVVTPVFRSRATVGLQAFPQLAPFVGASLSVAVVPETRLADGLPLFAPSDYATTGRNAVPVVWPGIFAGIQI